MPKFIIKICTPQPNTFFEETAAECFIIDTTVEEGQIRRMTAAAEQVGKIVLLEGENAAALCADIKADGIIADLRESSDIKKDMALLRQKCGGFLGIVCRNRRHEAMIVSENEPDFIIFKIWEDGKQKNRELTEWYSQLFLIKMAVEPENASLASENFYADMVILSPESYKILVAQKERLE